VAPCAIKANECATKKSKARVKSRMDQRTRTQLPLLPALLRAVDRQRKDAEARITAARATPTGGRFLVAGEEFERCGTGQARRVYVTEVAASRRRNLTHEEEAAFWSWATVEVLRHTGIRIEEMLELTHHSFIAYTLPTTGEVVPMLQVAPSKTDAERLLLVSPELAEVLTAVIFRVRAGNAALPLVSAYDVFEQTWSPPMPFLFQRRYGTEDRPLTRSYIRECLVATSQSAQITVAGDPLEWRPHDFRRIEAGGHARAYSPAVHRPPRHARHPPGRRTKQRRFGGLSTDTFGVSSAQNGGPLMGACGMIANMSEPELGLLSRLWDEHKRATFPPHLRGQDIEGEDMVMLDADIAGCVSSSLAGPLDERRRSILLRCLAALQKVVPSISDEGSAVEYYERLREMATLATEAGNAKAQ
jgi:hypothetical protein